MFGQLNQVKPSRKALGSGWCEKHAKPSGYVPLGNSGLDSDCLWCRQCGCRSRNPTRSANPVYVYRLGGIASKRLSVLAPDPRMARVLTLCSWRGWFGWPFGGLSIILTHSVCLVAHPNARCRPRCRRKSALGTSGWQNCHGNICRYLIFRLLPCYVLAS